ncbi:minor tail protein [Arthrobacter phage Rizwana]|nr:minor tail protein [Arthrobacter phage Rizwana]
MERAPRNMTEWMRSIERNQANLKRAVSTVPVSYYEKTQEDIRADKVRTPAAPVEITHQTSLYSDGVLARQYGRLLVDFPDVTKATDGTDIPITTYELWGRDDTSNLLESTTGAVPGAAAPGLTMPGLAATQAMKDAAAASQGQWVLLATSSTSSLRKDGLVPGSIWSFRVRAMGTYTAAPGLFSQVYQAQILKDETPPAQPTKPVLAPARGVITVKWDGLSVLGAMPADFSHLIVAAGDSSSPTAEVDRFFSGGGVTVLSDFDYYTPVFVRFQAVDLAGNKSPWSEQATAVTTPLVDTDVILSEIDAAKTVIKNVTGAALVEGAVRQEHLANNAVQQKHLADQIIDASKLEPTVNDQISKGISDAAAAQGTANAANTAAGNASAAALEAQKAVDAVITSGSSLLVNGGWEEGDRYWVTGTNAYSRDSASARSGSKVFFLDPATANAWAPNQYVPSQKGRTFYLEAWFRRIGNSGNAAHTVGFVAQSSTTAGGTSTVALPNRLPSTSLSETTWTKFSTTYTLPDTIEPYRTRFGPWALLSTNDYEVDDMVVLDITESKEAFDKAEAARLLAQSAFDDAQDALAAAGLAQSSANGKNSVYYPDTAPAGTGFKDGDIWFRGTDNKVHIWNATTQQWVAKTDAAIGIAKDAADAASAAAATADSKAVNAASAAADAAQAAQDAKDDALAADGKADAAQAAAANAASAAAAADSKAVNAASAASSASSAAAAAQQAGEDAALLANSIVKTSTSAATGTPPSKGALWNQTNADGSLIIKTWTANDAGTAWVLRKLDDAVIGNLNAATINAGTIAAARFNAQDIRTKFLEAGKITAADIVSQSLTSASGIFGTMDASVLNAGTLNAARIAAGSIAANKLIIGSGANAIPDPTFSIPELTTGRLARSSGTWTQNTATASGERSVSCVTNGTSNAFTYFTATPVAGDAGAAAIKVAAGQKWLLTVDVETSATAGVRWNMYRHRADGTVVYESLSSYSTGVGRRTLSTVYTVPVGTIALDLAILCNTSGVTVTIYGNAVGALQASATLIEDDGITTPKIATDAVRANHVKAGELVAAHIKADSLTSASGIFGVMDASVLNAGTLNAARLNAGDIRAKFLAAGKITADDMVTNTITAASGIIGSLDIGKVTTGKLKGMYIEANTLNVQHLKVSDLENFAPSYAESPEDWDIDTGLANVPTAVAAAHDKRRWSASGVTDGVAKLARGPYKAVKAGQELYAEGQIYRTGPTSNAINLRWYFYDANKAYMSPSISKTLDGVTNTPQDSPNAFVQKIMAVVPDGAMYARLILVIVNSTGDDIGMYNVMGRRRTNADLLVDGSVVAEKVATNALTAKHIQVGDFTNIAVGSDFDDASAVPWTLAANHIRSTTQKRSGTHSLRLGGIAGSAKSSLIADTRVKEGEEWYFSYWAYTDTAFDGTTGNSKLRIGDQSNAALKHIEFATIPKNAWKKVEGSLVIGAGVTSLTIELWNDNTNGYAYIDNIEIRRKSEASLIRNLGVEQLTASSAGIDQAVIDKLWTDVVNSRKITTEMLVVTGENMISNGSAEYGNNTNWSDWTYSTQAPTASVATGSFAITGTSSKYLQNNMAAMPVEPETNYVLQGWIKADKANSRCYLEFIENNGVNPTPQYALGNYVVPTVWTPFSVPVKTSAGQSTMRLLFYPNHVNGSERTATQHITGLRFRPQIGSDLVVNGSILTTHLGSESVTAEKIKSLSIETGHIKGNQIEADHLKTGSITAAKLDATLVLATRILAGPANDTHAEMNPTGFKVFAKDGLGQLNETVRLGVAATNDYLAVTNSAQELVTTISEDGTISARKLVSDEITYKGDDLQVVLDRASLGLVGWGQFNGNQMPGQLANGGIANGTERGLFEIAWQPVGTRMYGVSLSPTLFTPMNNTATAAAMRMRYTTDGTQPTTTSPILAEDFKPILGNGAWTMSFQFSDRLVGGFNGSYIRVLFTIAASNGAGLYTELGQSPTFMVKDLGPAYPKAGVISNQVGGGGGGSRPPVVTMTKKYTALDRRSYLESNGALYNYDTGRMYQGPSPAGVGKLASMAFFPDMTADLSGKTINDMQVYIYFDHWYNNSGGIAKIGLHGHTGAIPSTFNWKGWIMDSAGWPKPGGRWLRIPSTYWAGFQSGLYRGITLGMNTAGYEHYGIANGSPQIYVQYTG